VRVAWDEPICSHSLVLVRRARPLCRVDLPLGFGDHVLNCVLLRKSGLDLSGFPHAAIAALVSFLPFHSMMPRFIKLLFRDSVGRGDEV